MKESTNKHLLIALLVGLAFHGTSVFFTLESTYDALIHLFFADHYANSWFEPWNYNWYTGLTVTSYPPLVHQSIAMLSLLGGLKFGLFTMAIVSIVLFITGVYRFSLLITSNRTVAGKRQNASGESKVRQTKLRQPDYKSANLWIFE
jgi:hypothetical protein